MIEYECIILHVLGALFVSMVHQGPLTVFRRTDDWY